MGGLAQKTTTCGWDVGPGGPHAKDCISLGGREGGGQDRNTDACQACDPGACPDREQNQRPLASPPGPGAVIPGLQQRAGTESGCHDQKPKWLHLKRVFLYVCSRGGELRPGGISHTPRMTTFRPSKDSGPGTHTRHPTREHGDGSLNTQQPGPGSPQAVLGHGLRDAMTRVWGRHS